MKKRKKKNLEQVTIEYSISFIKSSQPLKTSQNQVQGNFPPFILISFYVIVCYS